MSYFDTSEKLVNPAQKFINWNASEGRFQYYNKEKKENIFLPETFEFLPVKQMATIKGYNNQLEGSFVSNEVRNTTIEAFNVRVFVKDKNGNSKQQAFEYGLYKDIKDKLKSAGAKFSVSMYALLDGELVNIQFYGASLTPFLDLDRNLVNSGATIKVATNPDIQKNGGVKYYVPTFSIGTKDEKLLEFGKETYKVIEEYFVAYRKQQENFKNEEEEQEDNTQAIAEQVADEISIDDINIQMPF